MILGSELGPIVGPDVGEVDDFGVCVGGFVKVIVGSAVGSDDGM